MKKIIISSTLLLSLYGTALLASADAGVEQEVQSGQLVQLDGSESSTEQEGKLYKFIWKQTAGEKSVDLSNRKSVTPTFIAPKVEEATVLTFKLTTKEKFKNKRGRTRQFRSRDFVNVIVLPNEEEVVIPTVPVENNADIITFNGLNYLPITSPITGRVWLDRNIGAKKVCESTTDKACFGDYYQWGRGSDGHQLRTSQAVDGTIDLLEKSDKFMKGDPEDGSYFSNDDWTNAKTVGTMSSRWESTSGDFVCPVSYRVPTILEIEDERLNTLSNNEIANNFLKLPFAGERKAKLPNVISGEKRDLTLWSSTPVFSGNDAKAFRRNVVNNYPTFTNGKLVYPSSETSILSESISSDTGNGRSVRCIKD